MSRLLRRISIRRLLLVCGVLTLIGASGAALASAVNTGPVPRPESLAQAIHDALAAGPVEGVSARIQYTNHLLEGASLAGASGQAGQLASSPLLQGASGRLWVAKDGRVRVELQSAQGDSQVILANRTISLYDSSSNTVYRYTLPQAQPQGSSNPPDSSTGNEKAPSAAQIEEAIAHLSKHADVKGASPSNIAGQPAYTARISPNESGSLLGGVELSWDAVHGVPLRAAVYSSTSSAPVIELTATEISYGPVESSVFQLTPPPGAKVVEPQRSHEGTAGSSSSSSGLVGPVGGATSAAPGGNGSSPGAAPGPGADGQDHPNLRTVGHGVSSVVVLETQAHGQAGSSSSNLPSGLSKVNIGGTAASELPTALGTLLSFERSGVNYVVAGALRPEAVEAVARGL
jgi:outer membrane lipoprotein-sorting protein